LYSDLEQSIPTIGEMLNSDAIDTEAEGYINVAHDMCKGSKKPMKWVSSLPLCLTMQKSAANWLTKEECLIQSSLLSKNEYALVQKRGCTIYEYLKSMYDTIFFSVFGEDVRHWSLLVWYIGKGKGFWHYDSLKCGKEDTNIGTASDVVVFLRWAGVLPDSLYDIRMPTWMPSQPGAWECGHYVVITVFVVCMQYIQSGKDPTDILQREHTFRYNQEMIKSLWTQYSDGIEAMS